MFESAFECPAACIAGFIVVIIIVFSWTSFDIDKRSSDIQVEVIEHIERVDKEFLDFTAERKYVLLVSYNSKLQPLEIEVTPKVYSDINDGDRITITLCEEVEGGFVPVHSEYNSENILNRTPASSHP